MILIKFITLTIISNFPVVRLNFTFNQNSVLLNIEKVLIVYTSRVTRTKETVKSQKFYVEIYYCFFFLCRTHVHKTFWQN